MRSTITPMTAGTLYTRDSSDELNQARVRRSGRGGKSCPESTTTWTAAC